MRVALFGSPDFALPTLRALYEHHDLALVVAQPDKKAGRGLSLTPPPVAERARALGLRLEQPGKLRGNEAFAQLLYDLGVNVAVTAAYGKILPQTLLDIPRHGFLNVHASLLPKYRGAAPIQWALINGERETGISIMQTEAGLDTGPVRRQRRLEITAHDTAATLFDKLSRLGADAILEALELLEHDDLPLCPQQDDRASYAPLLSKDDGRIRWHESAQAIGNRHRGVTPWPGSWTMYQDKTDQPRTLKVHGLEPTPAAGEPGVVLSVAAEGVSVAAGEGAVLLREVQPAGKAKMSARDWANGYGIRAGASLGAGVSVG
ncbi:MAG: methionyl-tRNA formyltransferase [Trueperaceae bacterium]|nr:methionyl-tRNA formyltransferase [Trueperaceae bacterium]